MKAFNNLVRLSAIAVGLAVSFPSYAAAKDTVTDRCSACHQMTGPALTDIASRQERKAPPLFYAGNKFNEEWLISWLQNPISIRPAGDFPEDHVKEAVDGDMVDVSTLVEHMRMGQEEATKVAEQLMRLTPNSDLITRENYTPKSISKRLGTMDFVKFKGCAACHRDTVKLGGLSGPELYTAWQRLQPEFIVSYIRDPMEWEPRSLMPNKHLQDKSIYKLANYLKTIGDK